MLEVGDLRLDPATHRVWRADQEVALTARQFSLLEFMMRRAGEVLSKAEILEHVWDFGFEGDPNIVEVYVRQLRQRIDEPFGCQSLQTVRLVGYRLDPDGGSAPGAGSRHERPRCASPCVAALLITLAIAIAAAVLVTTLRSSLIDAADISSRSSGERAGGRGREGTAHRDHRQHRARRASPRWSPTTARCSPRRRTSRGETRSRPTSSRRAAIRSG